MTAPTPASELIERWATDRINDNELTQGLKDLSIVNHNWKKTSQAKLVKILGKDSCTIYPNLNSSRSFPVIVKLEVLRFTLSSKQARKLDAFLEEARKILTSKGFDRIPVIIGDPQVYEIWILRDKNEIICDYANPEYIVFYKKAKIESIEIFWNKYGLECENISELILQDIEEYL